MTTNLLPFPHMNNVSPHEKASSRNIRIRTTTESDHVHTLPININHETFLRGILLLNQCETRMRLSSIGRVPVQDQTHFRKQVLEECVRVRRPRSFESQKYLSESREKLEGCREKEEKLSFLKVEDEELTALSSTTKEKLERVLHVASTKGLADRTNSYCRLKTESCAYGAKACREKMRRDKLNDRHVITLRLMPPKTDKVAILSDDARVVF
ncbi:hypothetical protein V8G54_010734 [Vigna mungo]|uniref:Uncharacterized protein n=1 Tax=Vigna mungo TaxID=3915 RepID=A0AAQ3NZQ3_VIGMU